MPIKLKSKTKKPLYIYLIIGLLLLILIGGIIFATTDNWLKDRLFVKQATQPTSLEEATNNVDYSGPTQTDIDQSQDGKKNSEKEETPSQDTSTQKSDARVAVSFADVIGNNVEVRSFIPNLIEGDGICTAALTQGSSLVTKSNPAFIDVSSSQCQPIYIPLSEFPTKGEWKLVVTYKSTLHTGASEEIKVNL